MEKKLNKQNKKFRRWFQLAGFIVSIAILIFYVMWKVGTNSDYKPYGIFPPEMVSAQHTPRDVIGDLGGMKVVIPRYYAKYVEYDDSPGFVRKEQRPVQKKQYTVRTFDSRLESFGMDVRFPDMKGLVDWRTRQEKRREPLHESNWLSVGVSAGKYYYGDEALNRLARVVLKPDEYPRDYWRDNYIKLPENEYGLEAYMVTGNNPNTGKPARDNFYPADIYLQQQPTGKVDTYIACLRAHISGGIARCNMRFTLEPKAHVGIEVYFRRDLLQEWRKIKASTHDLLLSFEVKENPKPSAPTTNITSSN